jgi:hypothetical protein
MKGLKLLASVMTVLRSLPPLQLAMQSTAKQWLLMALAVEVPPGMSSTSQPPAQVML